MSNRSRNIVLAALIIFYFAFNIHGLVEGLEKVGKPYPGFWILSNLTVPSPYYSDLEGYKRGVKYSDVIISIDGKKFRDGDEALDYVASNKSGDLLEYEVQVFETGEIKKITVPVQVVTFRDYLFFFLLPKLNGLLFYLIGLAVFYLKPNAKASWALLLFNVSVGMLIAGRIRLNTETQRHREELFNN